MRVNTCATSPITLGGSTSQVGSLCYQVKRTTLVNFTLLVDLPFWCFGLLLCFFGGAWWSWDLSWSISVCFVLFLGRVILTVLQETMETRFSSFYFSIFCLLFLPSFILPSLPSLVFSCCLCLSSLLVACSPWFSLLAACFLKNWWATCLLLDHHLPPLPPFFSFWWFTFSFIEYIPF